MTDRRINPYGVLCNVTLDLPWDVAEHLVEHGPAIIRAIAAALEDHKTNVEMNARLRVLAERDQRRKRKAWSSLARVADRELRRRLRSGTETRWRIISSIADEYGVEPGSIEALVSSYRHERRAQIGERRRAQVIRHYFAGLSDAEIGARLRPPVSAAHVSNMIRKERRLIQALRETNQAFRLAEARLSDG